ncbi:MAG: hypothetical protein DMF10_09860 [Verrucomicrobia bacterium]|nr:MAG: hypothetical protein DMF10_09860 [Verrucomicrobiota bacterium]PYI46936.1 MAG: hypothetical protein DMF11_07480 [Verrucomicrobiota bacterium]
MLNFGGALQKMRAVRQATGTASQRRSLGPWERLPPKSHFRTQFCVLPKKEDPREFGLHVPPTACPSNEGKIRFLRKLHTEKSEEAS